MPKKNQIFYKDNVKVESSLGSRILQGLTEAEISQLLDSLFAILSDEQRQTAFAQLEADTHTTLIQIIAPSQTGEQAKTTKRQATSLAKLAQTWSDLWREWNEIITEASQSEGKYIVQEESWEEPYFDDCALVEDLEAVAQKMKPLLETAFTNSFSYAHGFAANLLEAESEISDGIADWMEIRDGINLQPTITHCLLEWEWLRIQKQGQDAFKLAKQIREWEEKVFHISLDDDAVIDFFSDLPDEQKKLVLAGMTAERDSSLWKYDLENTFSYWHLFYMEVLRQFATPEIYLNNLRATISQEWQNGLPVIEDLLAKQEYRESLTVIQETLDALLKNKPDLNPWTPENSLLFVAVGGFSYEPGNWEKEKTLLRYYQQAVRELGEIEWVNALSIQHITFECCYDWSSMFKAFTEIPVNKDTHKALFTSWRESIIKRGTPYRYSYFYTNQKPVDTWWLHWLLDSITSKEKGHTWFRQQIIEWLENLPGDEGQLGGEYSILHLLTKDLTEIKYQGKSPYPKFYEIVILPNQLSTRDDISRRMYLQEYAPPDLWERVMAYWQANLHNFVPRPDSSQSSDYTKNAQWMSALKELAPQSYDSLLSQWKVQHKRRPNLWKAMRNLGLD
ncbi:hypothetical protein [Nostoc sp. 'Peltigera membranacea cyanobiont' 232]|uniref:hypothetical protein n=1 Tax=Nostoc sp. 'Peltigera membranacea cyanobiont' 232 TaxID=2014531 RepID=UPI001CB8900C|nr:hypothetical protein [Nostoc sp. 'Peltigera membranacea cyanobiont' 232]